MGTYNIPRNVKGEGRILFIFTPKSLIYSAIGLAIGIIFYFIFKIVGLSILGWISLLLFAAIGWAIGTMKVPKLSILKFTKVVYGEKIDDIIKRAILFKKRNNKIYVYDNKEVENNDR